MQTRTLQATTEAIDTAAALLRAGELVVMPTETVYGLAADATQPRAVARIFAAKGRPADDPLIVHVATRSPTITALGPVCGDVSTPARRTAEALMSLWPGALTIVLPRGPAVPPAVTSGLPFVALRCPAHPVAQALIRALGRPVVAPSANRFGRISPTTAEAAHHELSGNVPLILDAGPCQIGVESTVLRVESDGSTTLLRPGAVTADQIAALTGRAPEAHTAGPKLSPGMMDSHYAPTTPLVLVDPHSSADLRVLDAVRRRQPRAAWLAWSYLSASLHEHLGAIPTGLLAPDNTPDAGARRLYGCLRDLDASGAALIVCERPPDASGLSAAILDRLRRAAASTAPLSDL